MGWYRTNVGCFFPSFHIFLLPFRQPWISFVGILIVLKKLTPILWTQRLIRNKHVTSAKSAGVTQHKSDNAGAHVCFFTVRHECPRSFWPSGVIVHLSVYSTTIYGHLLCARWENTKLKKTWSLPLTHLYYNGGNRKRDGRGIK